MQIETANQTVAKPDHDTAKIAYMLFVTISGLSVAAALFV